MLLTFAAPLVKDVTTALRKAGFRYSRVMQHWKAWSATTRRPPWPRRMAGPPAA